MKIAIEARSLTVQKTGIPRYVITLLTKIAEFDFENEYILFSDIPIKENLLKKFGPNWKNIPMGKRISKARQMPKYVRFLKNGCAKELPDVFWAPTVIIPNLRRLKIRSIMTVHDIIPVEHPEIYRFTNKFYFKHYLLKGFKNSDEIVFVSETVKESVNALFSKKMKFKKQFLVFNVVNIDDEIGIYEDEGVLKNIDSEYLIFIGTKEKRKGILIISEVAKLIKNLPYKIVVVGKDGAGTNIFREQTKNSENIIELPYVTDEEKKALLHNASALLFPSLAEGFGIPLIEATNLKKPVIASDIPVFMEILGGNYFNFRSGNAESLANTIEEFSKTSPDEMKELVEKAYAFCQKYDVEKEAKKLHGIFTEKPK